MVVLANQVLLAVEEEGGAGLSIILPPPAELFWGAVAFAIFYFVMARLAFPKINEVLEERAASIQGRQEEAQAALAEAERVRAQYQEQLRDARGEANRIIEEARQTAESLRRDIVAKAEAEAEAIVQRAQSEVRGERERAVQQLRGEVARLSVQLAEKIVEKEIDSEAHRALIDRYIQSLSGGNGQTRVEPSAPGGGVGLQERPGEGGGPSA